ncbi:hypothetical protein PIB30_013684 [Stylosanthes scabra]|uniref:GDSL esterase/lipase n=1 Tax=Stylosanthes scabra TaxID=79078 RepID=A0ABU6W6F8_9FABA|nr:hypothetical protein [Stylosanthes scabra]
MFAIAAANGGQYPALFAFGDSILDTGNNNNLATITKCNFPPYGRDFVGGTPTGRFCDGKVPSDLIAGSLGIKETLPAYLDLNLRNEDIPTGVSFASGGTGNDILTAQLQGVLSLPAQLKNFQEYIGRLKALVGEERANNIISNSLYLLSSGNNDIAITYANSPLRKVIPFPQYASQLVSWASDFLKQLYGAGARNVWVLSTLPLGCLPGGRTAAGGPLRFCADFVNGQAQLFNSQLSSAVTSLQSTLSGSNLQFIDVYDALLNIINNPLSSGFANVASGCCGTGLFEIGATCNLAVGSCPYPASFVFWDAGHPTQRAYQLIVSSILHQNTTRLSK